MNDPVTRDRIRWLRTKLKELAALQRTQKAVLRQPHHDTTYRDQVEVGRRALRITIWHGMLNELCGRAIAHKLPACLWYTTKTIAELQTELAEAVPAVEPATTSA